MWSVILVLQRERIHIKSVLNWYKLLSFPEVYRDRKLMH